MSTHPARGQAPPPSPLFRGMTLRVRLTLWVVAIFALTWWTIGGIFWLYQRAAIRESADERLMVRARALSKSIAPLLPNVPAARIRELAIEQLQLGEYGHVEVEILDSELHIISRWGGRQLSDQDRHAAHEAIISRRPLIYRLARAQAKGLFIFDVRYDRVAAIPVRGEADLTYLVVIAAEDTFARDQKILLSRAMIVGAVIGPFASAISGWFLAGIAVSPLKRIRHLVANLSPQPFDAEDDGDAGSRDDIQRLEAELVETRSRILERFAAQERFLSNVSHEIKTPLAVMITEAETLDRTNIPESAADFIDSARDEMTRLGQLVESFLTLARVQEGRVSAHTKQYAVIDLVMDSLENCQMMAKQHHVHLTPRFNVSEQPEEASLSGDPQLLRTMLDNLVRNAIRFSPEDGIVAVEVMVNSGFVRIRVLDEGPGIPPDLIAKIFDRYVQAHQKEQRGRGHGLGLSIALGIAEMHGGTITADNRVGKGCEFLIFLPRGDRGVEISSIA